MAEGSLHGFFADLARLYPDLDTAFLRSISAEFDQVAVAGGSTLVRRGEPSDALYIVISGRLVATQQDEGGELLRLGEIGRGEMIGEMSILSGGMRTATVTALRDSRLVRISNQTFLEFMQRHPSVTRQFIQILTSRLTNRAPRRQEKLSTLALVPGRGLRGSDAFAGFVHEIEAALRGMVDIAIIDRGRIEAMFPGALARTDADAGIARWLDDEEQRHDLLVYVCDEEATAWTHRCLRQADRVLVIAQAGAVSAEPEGIERFLDDSNDDDAAASRVRGRELVLLHPPGTSAPQDTARWLALRHVRRHHHLRAGDPAAMARLCRHLLGRSVGLALGGGGAKAFAEVGVLRALAEAGVPVDVIGGTSMGAVVGALAALGQDAREIHATLHNMLSFKPFSGLTLPLVSLLSGKRLDLAMHALFGDTNIEDLWLRYFCISCNLTHGTVKTAESGRLRRWVAASNAVPGIMPPLVDGGELFVDGGLMNNVPADIMSSLNAGPVIAVNVSNVTTLHAGVPDDTDLSGWSVLMNGLAGRGRDAGDAAGTASPRLGRLLVRAMLLGSSNHAATMRNFASLYLTPPIDGIDVGDWQALDSLVETGYAYASKALETWNRDAMTN
jgi:predicted acylesterase/phospholipase RssA/CRP-like cAMP-binding protein